MKRYEYYTETKTKADISEDAFKNTLNELGKNGWELIEIVSASFFIKVAGGGVDRYICIFKRELD